jgi:hypothetical protein
MSKEVIRGMQVTVQIDTNKSSSEKTYILASDESFNEFVERVRDAIIYKIAMIQE